ncbi:MAG: restriction endonuclease subunit S [Acidobacteriota bacterium]|nr:restriction endonuclease subunit S [Acidobacteriota bacterium]MDE3266685.1 restriction endonuclease subunit S [Acidobacteriota bacterium]
MTAPIDIRADHLHIVRDVLREHLPAGVKVWVFGSRATWKTKDSSDLDLALEGSTEIPPERLAALEAAFEESDLPFAVDVVDTNRIGERFRRIVSEQRVVLVHSANDRGHQGDCFRRVDLHATRRESSSAAPGWQEARLGDVVRLLSGGTPSKGRAAYWDGEIPWVSARDMKVFRLRDTSHHVTLVGLANGTRQVPAGTLLLLTRGMRLLKELPVCVTERPMAFNQDIKALLVKACVEPGFLPYLVVGNKRRLLNLVDLAGHGTGRINSDELRALDVRLPPTREQRAIAHTLGTLDDKIELNRRLSETLEGMARALFKSWFVDFDPVRAKMEGRDTGLPRGIADLFPDRLVDSEMGEIPEGWTVTPLGELIDVNPKRPLQRGEVVPYLPMAKMPTQGHVPTSVDLRPFGSGMRFANGDTLVARITPCLENGKTAYVDFLSEDEVGWGSTEYIVLKPKPPLPDQYAYCLARSAGFREFAIRNMSGTSGRQRVPATAVKGHLMVAPPERLAGEFGDCAKSLFERASRARRESDTLVALRDTLLPRLISGEIRVPEAERALEPVT